MSSHTFSVTQPEPDDNRLPDWSAQYVLLVEQLRRRGWLGQIGEHLRVYRQGGYAGLDGFLFLLAMFCWTRPGRRGRALKAFDEACSFCRRALAAVGGREKFARQSSMARLLRAVPAGEMLLEFGSRVLAFGVQPLASHRDAQTRDTLGQSWNVFDFDLVSTVVRQRGLPQGEDLPPPVRRAVMTKPGHPGRKRGEAQISAGCMQHAGSGLWVQVMLESGNGSMSTMLSKVLPFLGKWLDTASLAREQTVVRGDAAAGYMPSLNAFSANGVHFLTRLTCYGLLDRPQVRAHLARMPWLVVPSSGSGPTRQVCELGIWPCQDGPAEEAPEGLTQARLLVTRYKAARKHGAGLMRDGWQYEIFGTSVQPQAWPAPELVALYFGRASEENRFAQVMAELQLNKVFSCELGGQWLAVLVGLLVSNLRTILGAERAGPLQAPAIAPQLRATPKVADGPTEPAPSAPETSPSPEPAPLLVVEVTPTEVASPLLRQLDKQAWSALARHPGWSWRQGRGLQCPNGRVLSPFRVRMKADEPSTVVFRAREGDCQSCPVRDPCGGPPAPARYRRTIAVPVVEVTGDAAQLHEQILELRKQRRRRNAAPTRLPTTPKAAKPPRSVVPQPVQHAWRPPTSADAGPWAVQAPRLVPTVFRQGLQLAVRDVRVSVAVERPPQQQQPPTWQAPTAAIRQRRRLTWTERLARNALPDTARVCSRVVARDPWLAEMLGPVKQAA